VLGVKGALVQLDLLLLLPLSQPLHRDIHAGGGRNMHVA
jgi:hypothetical protein